MELSNFSTLHRTAVAAKVLQFRPWTEQFNYQLRESRGVRVQRKKASVCLELRSRWVNFEGWLTRVLLQQKIRPRWKEKLCASSSPIYNLIKVRNSGDSWRAWFEKKKFNSNWWGLRLELCAAAKVRHKRGTPDSVVVATEQNTSLQMSLGKINLCRLSGKMWKMRAEKTFLRV